MGSAKDVWTLLALSYPKQSFTAGFNRMSKAKGDLILLPWRENGLFWFSLDGEQSLSPVFLKASDPGGTTQQVLCGKAPLQRTTTFGEISAIILPYIHTHNLLHTE